jgi:subtilisin family serine protease
MRNIKSFAGMIHGLSDDCAEPRETWMRNKIRIASIDTGIDKDDDIIIQTALECDSIKECCSFTGNGEDVQDSHGHGTHIARLLLDIAPAAELYVAKVSDGQTLYPSSLSRIAEVTFLNLSLIVHFLMLIDRQ